MLISLSKLCSELQVSRRHAQKLLYAGSIPHYRVGSRAVRFDLDEVKAFFRVESQQKPGLEPNHLEIEKSR